MKQATEGAHVGTFEYDHINQTLTCDDIIFELYGVKNNTYPSVFEMWRSCIHPDDLKAVDNMIQASIRGESAFDTEFRVVWPDKSLHYIKSKAEVIRDEKGKALRILGANWDVTKEKTTELELKHSNERDSIFVQQLITSHRHSESR